ncbi:MAG: CBS domain-containing protein [Saprospiraceae bacterium]|nr:CBS domain-containing protein [Saprospiraceae bacterium]
MKVRSIMTDVVKSVHVNTGLLAIKDIFETNDFHHMPVLDDKRKVVGMISRLDYHLVLDHFTIFRVDKARRTNDRFLGALIAKDVMSKNLATIDPDTDIAEANKVFLENLLHALPVVEHGELIGIITTHDVLKHYSEMLLGQKKIQRGH